MAAILHRQPLTIKQQVEELKNWNKQQQSKLVTNKVDSEKLLNKINANEKGKHFTDPSSSCNSDYKINFDEIPIKVTNTNFNSLVENNVAPDESTPVGEVDRSKDKNIKPKFRFLKKGEGIARFNMGPLKVANKRIPIKQNRPLKLIKDTSKCDNPIKESPVPNELKSMNLGEMGGNIHSPGTLKVPDVKLNFTWKSILSAKNPEDMLEKAISTNQLEMMDPNSSIDSSTASLMEKLLALGKNKLSKDREELRVFETLEQHMLDSSFCSTSSYVTKLMENAVISTPTKETCRQQPQTSNITSMNSDRIPSNLIPGGVETSSCQGNVLHTMANPSSYFSVVENHEKPTRVMNAENLAHQNRKNHINNIKQSLPQDVATWTEPNDGYNTTAEESIQNLESSLHVRFAEHVDYKSFMEHTQSVENIIQKENGSVELDDSQEWKEDSEDSSSCCSQCSRHNSTAENRRDLQPQGEHHHNNQYCSQSEERKPVDILDVDGLKIRDKAETIDNNDINRNGVNNFPPLLIAKLRELEEEIKVFREENCNIRTLRENLERERKQVQEEKRRLNIEKKKLQKEVEDERKKLIAQLEEEKQKLTKEKTIFEKYSKSLTKNPSREERKEMQALREQLAEMKEELNKKESRWGAAQARVRNQVKVLEEDNKKLKEEIESFRKQAKYWDLFNQKKKGKPFNNTKLIHAISEHISNIVLDNEGNLETIPENSGYFNQNSSAPKTSSSTHSNFQSMYGIKVIREDKNSIMPNRENSSKSVSNLEDDSSRKEVQDLGADDLSKMNRSDSHRTKENPSVHPSAPIDPKILGGESRCQKPCLDEELSNVIKEVTDENGNAEIIFPNGNIKKINKITRSEKYIYINGDVEEITHNGTVKYYYSKSRIWQTTLPDGLEIVDFPDGKVEKRHVNGTVEIIYSNNNKKYTYPDGSQEIIYADGTKLTIKADKTQVLILPNGQKEIHTEEWKRREYPDGTMKTLYPDGTTETVYYNGRVRLKDKYGNLVMDSSPSSS